MTYADFTSLESALEAFGLTATYRPLFLGLRPVEPPADMAGTFAWGGGKPAVRRNEKGRSEFLIAPVIAAVDVLAGGSLTVYSGQALNVDPVRGLAGECDFVVGGDAAAVVLQAPLLTVVEAKKADIDLGTGQAVAQMVAVREYNQRAGRPTPVVGGCVTTGTSWQFLQLDGPVVAFEPRRFLYGDLPLILAAFLAAVAQARGAAG